MTDFCSEYVEEWNQWMVLTPGPPTIIVAADTEEMGRNIIERAIVWRREKREKKLEQAKDEVLKILQGGVELAPIEESVVDTAPSEILTTYEQSAYMTGDEGC